MKFKILLIFIIYSCFSISTYAQDTLLKKDGSEIIGKILEVTTNSIKYKRLDNPGGPIYEIMKSDLFMIKFENGSKEVFNSMTESIEIQSSQKNQFKKSQSDLPKQANLNRNSINLNILRLPFNPSFVSLGFELGLNHDLALELRAHYSTQRRDAGFPGHLNTWTSNQLNSIGARSYSLQHSKIGLGIKAKKYFNDSNHRGIYIGIAVDGQYILYTTESYRVDSPSYRYYYGADGTNLALSGAVGYKKYFSDRFFIELGIEGGYVLNLVDEYDNSIFEPNNFSPLWFNPIIAIGFKL